MDSFVSAIVSLVIKTVNIHFIQSPNYSFYSIAKLYFVNSFATSFLILSVKNCGHRYVFDGERYFWSFYSPQNHSLIILSITTVFKGFLPVSCVKNNLSPGYIPFFSYVLILQIALLT